jgi:hypothetical protein
MTRVMASVGWGLVIGWFVASAWSFWTPVNLDALMPPAAPPF